MIQNTNREILIRDPIMTNFDNITNEYEKELMMKAYITECHVLDQFNRMTGIEYEQLLYSIDQLRLRDDPEFAEIA